VKKQAMVGSQPRGFDGQHLEGDAEGEGFDGLCVEGKAEAEQPVGGEVVKEQPPGEELDAVGRRHHLHQRMIHVAADCCWEK
jgi:hypothetical protein